MFTLNITVTDEFIKSDKSISEDLSLFCFNSIDNVNYTTKVYDNIKANSMLNNAIANLCLLIMHDESQSLNSPNFDTKAAVSDFWL